MNHTEDWVIEAENLSYSYEENDRKALDGLSVRIGRGKKVAFMGGNGSGKSTFFLCLNGILRPDKGRVLIDGKPVSYTRKGLMDVRKKVGVVFQEPENQLLSASVFQEISFGSLTLGTEEETARTEVGQVIRALDITPFKDRPAHALSGGQKKQVAIADILVMHPQVMILDEPASALDAVHTKKVHELIRRLTEQGITVLMSLHDIDYAWSWADEIVLMDRGRVIRQGTPREVCEDEAALRQAGLERPAVLRIYEKLKEKGVLSGGRIPGSMDELTEMLL